MPESPYLGEVTVIASVYVPKYAVPCEGQLMPISQYQALFSIIGTTYGGDGRSTFAVPDFRGATPVGVNSTSSYNPARGQFRPGQMGGRETQVLTTDNMPSHNHIIKTTSNVGEDKSPSNGLLATTDCRYPANVYNTAATSAQTLSDKSISKSGLGNPIPIVTHSLCMQFGLWVIGSYPPRT